MKERLLAFWDSVKGFFGKISHVARVVLVCALIGLIAIAIALAVTLNKKEYVILNNDYNRSEQTTALGVLSEQGVDYSLTHNGTIMVLDKDEDRARMLLAASGLPGGVYEPSYSPGLTSTESDKTYMQNTELQKRLQSVIQTMPEVETVAVTITQPERSAFALKTDIIPPRANVSITTKENAELSPEQVQGIITIVRGSVADIEDADISVVDTVRGDLKEILQTGTGSANATKMQLMGEVNTTLRNQAMVMLTKIFGEENVEVQVNAVLDTDTRESESVAYNPLDPENPQNNPLDYGEHDRQTIRNDENLAEGVPGANDNIGTPQYGEEFADTEGVTDYNVHDIYDYLVGHTKEKIVKEGLQITSATAAVAINSANLPNNNLADGTREQVITMIANATGVPVENVSVHSYEFYTKPVPNSPTILPENMTTQQILLISLIALLILAIIIFTIILIISKRRKQREAEEQALLEQEGEYAEDFLFDGEEQDNLEPIMLAETAEQKLRAQIKELADSDPEIVASLLKNWLSS